MTTLPVGVGFDPNNVPLDEGPAGLAHDPLDMLAGEDFGLGTNAQGQQGPGAWEVDRGTSSANELVRKLWRMSPREVEQLQLKLYQAGYYTDTIYTQHRAPSWGVVDETTQEAFYRVLLEGARTPEKTLAGIMDDGAVRNRDRLAALQTKGDLVDVGAPEVVSLPSYNLTDPASLRTLYKAVSQSLIGKDLTPEQEQSFADAIRSEQTARGEADQGEARTAAQLRAEVAAAKRAKDAAGPEATNDEVSAFTRSLVDTIIGPASAVGVLQNTGLNRYGLDADTLRDWAADARAQGVAVPALSSPQAVDLVVDWKIRQLYKGFGGDWESVATSILGDIDSATQASGTRRPQQRGRSGAAALTTPGGAGFDSSGRLVRPDRMGAQRGIAAGTDASGRLIRQDRGPSNAANLMAEDLGGMSYPSQPLSSPGLTGLAQQLIGSMSQVLGRAPGTQAQQNPGAVQAPIFTGGAPVEQIDPQARAEEQIRREQPNEVLQHGYMQQLSVLDRLIGGAR